MELSDIPLKYLLLAGLVASVLVILGLLVLSVKTVISIGLIVLGFTMVWKTAWWMELFGRNPWAEEHLAGGVGAGMGGSWLFYKLLGIVVMVVAFLYWTGSIQGILAHTLGVFFGGSAP